MVKREELIPPGALLEHSIEGVRKGVNTIVDALGQLHRDPDAVAREFAHLEKTAHSGAKKVLLEIDNTAEAAFAKDLRKKWPSLQVLGEESLVHFEGWQGGRICVLADMIDGTDFVEMGLDLWCSAVVLYDLTRHEILGSIVGLPSGQIFYTSSKYKSAWIRGRDDADVEVFGCSKVKKLENARIAFYGQKPKNLLAVLESSLVDCVARYEKTEGPSFRLYNFAGNPMMVKLVNRPKLDGARVFTGDIDAVFEVAGQQLHDVVPGAYIALKAGAHMCDLQGRPITVQDLGQRLANPKDRISYVLAATEELALELTEALQTPASKPASP